MPGKSHTPQHKILTDPKVLLVIAILVTSVTIWRIAIYTEKRAFDQIEKTGNTRIALYAASLRDTLERYKHIPYLLARESRIRNLLKGDLPPVRVNQHLEDFSLAAGALIFVMDNKGTTVASSNWRTAQTLIGGNFAFRPYFQDASKGKWGGYYAVGFKTRQPGYFISYPVLDTGNLLGVVVVKVNLEKLQDVWRKSNETIVVSDASGILFLSSRSTWKYKSLRPLPHHTAQWLREVQYLEQPLTLLQFKRKSIQGGNLLQLDGTSFFEQSLQLPEYGWRIHYLTDLQPMNKSVRLAVIISIIVAITMFTCILYLRERRLKLLSEREARKAKAIRKINKRLKEEIALHKETERTLRKTQKELIQAGKLAALGRMSAAIAHELNQPVTAIRTFIASCKIFLQRQQPKQVQQNLDIIDGLTERMTTLTSQLKTFARKNKGREEPIDLVAVIDRVFAFTDPQLQQNGITVIKKMVARGKAIILGDAFQLEQVINNLLNNGQDAMETTADKTIRIDLTIENDHVILSCHDNGPGLPEDILEHLFDPFFTTKDVGCGLGLGLSITYGIVQEMNGTISAANHHKGGAVFTLHFPLAEPQ